MYPPISVELRGLYNREMRSIAYRSPLLPRPSNSPEHPAQPILLPNIPSNWPEPLCLHCTPTNPDIFDCPEIRPCCQCSAHAIRQPKRQYPLGQTHGTQHIYQPHLLHLFHRNLICRSVQQQTCIVHQPFNRKVFPCNHSKTRPGLSAVEVKSKPIQKSNSPKACMPVSAERDKLNTALF